MASDVRPPRPRPGFLACIWLFFFTTFTSAFYVPGYSIKSYKTGENIPLLVNKIYSDNTQLQYAYFDLPFVCPPSGSRRHGSNWASGQHLSQNLGEVLRGDRIRNSDFEINMGHDVECAYLCDRSVSGRDVQTAQELVKQGYLTEWILDDLPGATSFITVDRKRKYYAAGFKIGYKDYDMVTGKPNYYLNNHFTFLVRWRKAPGSAGDNGAKVVTGFEVYTKSINADHRNSTGCPLDILDNQHPPLPLSLSPNNTLAEQYADSSYIPPATIDLEASSMTVPYTYSVYFREEKTLEWTNRWDLYFHDQQDSTTTHWLAIVNSIIVSSVLGAVCIIIWLRTTSGDVRMQATSLLEEAKLLTRKLKEKPSALVGEKLSDSTMDDLTDDELMEDMAGWKVLHADVFRTPPHPAILAPLIGSGLQLIFMLLGLLTLSCLGILNPSWRGGFISVGFALFILAGALSGYFSARVYKTFGGKNFKRNALMTALPFPALLTTQTLLLNSFTWLSASSTAIPFTTLLLLLLIWLLIQLPLVHGGSLLGSRCAAYTHPTRMSAIPRQIPAESTVPWYSRNTVLLPLLGGLPPFAVLLIELLFIFHTLYLDKSSYYYVFGFLLTTFLLLLITVAESTVIVLYLLLVAENWQWWWPAFFTGASSGVWIFAWSFWFYHARLHITGFVSTILFFGYVGVGCMVWAVGMGAVGVGTGWLFLRRIYGSVKVD